MILIAPYAKKLLNGMPHAKDYPYWKELLEKLPSDVVQIGVAGEKRLARSFKKNLKLSEVADLVRECEYWISVDSFLPHLASHIGKRGVVLWSVSDPVIFGYPENINILKDRSYLRKKQFAVWEEESRNLDAFVAPDEVIRILKEQNLSILGHPIQ